MLHTIIAMDEKEYYIAPAVELMLMAQGNSLLTTFSGDIERWEDDEVYEETPMD